MVHRRCIVFGCKNNKRTKPELTFFSFPKDEILRHKWLLFCNRKNKTEIKQQEAICSVHFTSDSIERNLRAELLNTKVPPKLVKNAIPIIRDENESSTFFETALIEKQRENKAIVEELLARTTEKEPEIVVKMECDEAEEDVKPLIAAEIEEINSLKQEISDLNIEIYTLKGKNYLLKQELRNQENTLRKMFRNDKRDMLSTYFTPGQVTSILSGGKRCKWSKEDISEAIILRNISRKAYDYLRDKKSLPLPSNSTLKIWLRNNWLNKTPTKNKDQ